jgi:hypothetical protein
MAESDHLDEADDSRPETEENVIGLMVLLERGAGPVVQCCANQGEYSDLSTRLDSDPQVFCDDGTDGQVVHLFPSLEFR